MTTAKWWDFSWVITWKCLFSGGMNFLLVGREKIFGGGSLMVLMGGGFFQVGRNKQIFGTSLSPLYIYIYIYIYVIACPRFCLKQMCRLPKTMAEIKCEHWIERWNWSSCTKLTLTASWTHGLIAQLVSVWTEFSGHGFKSHSGQLSIAISKILLWWIPYTCIYQTQNDMKCNGW